MTQDIRPLRVSNDALDDPAELQRRIADEGYLFFRGLMPAKRLRALRYEMMSAIQEAGWLIAGTNPADGIADINMRYTEGDNEYTAGYAQVYKLENFHRSAHWGEVTSAAAKILGGEIMPHPQKVARIWFPKYTEHTTPTHQDYVHFQGSFNTLTCWAPVGDCPLELGGLAVIPRSQRVQRVLDHHFSLGAGGLIVDETEHAEINPVWYSAEYECGDALFFPALTIHKALPNTTEDRLRLSLDNRYVKVGEEIAEHMLLPHGPSKLGWEDIYPHWQQDDLKYYWRDYDNPVVARDMSFKDKGWAEALSRARQGDEDAIYSLARAIKNDPKNPYDDARAVLAERGVAL
ncbi:MAG: phytanoyl-CoA dioxygenase family protein [Chloroflexi bacterium]|nr:phytanoyl-CoA dioxygenase family protein [Chloroflexota bacterium]MCY4246364.1 phytanoyl-CoA dioxygenase family protein [Chloroflexota bacterium]